MNLSCCSFDVLYGMANDKEGKVCSGMIWHSRVLQCVMAWYVMVRVCEGMSCYSMGCVLRYLTVWYTPSHPNKKSPIKNVRGSIWDDNLNS